MGLTAQRRREEIVRLANSTGLASVERLSEQFSVTSSTIRRDLAQLTTAGQLARTYGGAIAISPHSEASLKQRSGEAFEAKRGIAAWAARQVRPGETVLLDSGSTVGALAHELRSFRDITVVTPSLAALGELAAVPGIRVECLGGTLRPLSQGFVGPLAELCLERLTFDRAFLGADSVTADNGICEADLQQSRLKELVMRRSANVYVLAHAEKLGRRPFHTWTTPPAPWTLVTDSSADADRLKPFTDGGVTVAVVDTHGEPRPV
ncbi:MAG TPA: DeoR/GlpR family DNA-binding transcription regulator [Mycobacteriales bacterium]|jgi:DeoR/GlpR family transcriptional regulator of sugar metabolism|nr:DeoR/GlpR family DNA-binding transcription regulator [Mycobacteriales bacterium]